MGIKAIMLKVVHIEDEYYLKSDSEIKMADILELVYKNNGMRKGSFAEKYVIKILSDLLFGAIDLKRKYQKYYANEYKSLSEYLYKKELLEKEMIDALNLNESETIWKLRFATNNYSIKEIIGYEDENLGIINQTLEYMQNEN